MVEDYAPTTYSETLNRAMKVVIMLDCMDREKQSQAVFQRANQGLIQKDATSKDKDKEEKEPLSQEDLREMTKIKGFVKRNL